MKLTNKQSGQAIDLPYDLYPIDDLNWCPVVAVASHTLTGALDIQQAVKLAGKPITLQSQDGLGVVTRDVVNRLHAQCAIPEATFIMEYDVDGTTKQLNVVFDHTQTPISAVPLKGFNSPNLDDYFLVTVKFLVV